MQDEGRQQESVVSQQRVWPQPSRRVLWIDDEISDDQVEVRSLRELGFEVTCVQSGEAGLNCLRSESFDAILLDLNMPGKSGLDVLEDLLQRKNRIPVLVMTGFGTMERAVAAMKLGAVDVLSKPAGIDALAARLREVRARYPEGTDPPSITEAEWVRLQCERLTDCINRDDAIETVLRMLLSERVTLRYFHGGAAALKMLLTSEERSLAVLRSQARAAIVTGLTAPWPRDPRLLKALAELDHGPEKESQSTFAKRLGFSRAYLSRLLFCETQRRPSQWCRAAVLRGALRQLLAASDSVTFVAANLGYSRDSQFHREFVALFGVPPMALKKRVRS